MDYAFLGIPRGSREEVQRAEEEAERQGHSACLVMHDSATKGVYAYLAGVKGANDNLCRRIVQDLDTLGYKEIIIKGDQEPAIEDVMREVARYRGQAETILEFSPVRDSQSNGLAEKAVQIVEGW